MLAAYAAICHSSTEKYSRPAWPCKALRAQSCSWLQESRKNQLKDFVHVAGPLKVSHFLILTATEQAAYVRLCKVPKVSPVGLCMSVWCMARRDRQHIVTVWPSQADITTSEIDCWPAHLSADQNTILSALHELNLRCRALQ